MAAVTEKADTILTEAKAAMKLPLAIARCKGVGGFADRPAQIKGHHDTRMHLSKTALPDSPPTIAGAVVNAATGLPTTKHQRTRHEGTDHRYSQKLMNPGETSRRKPFLSHFMK